jgi:hypothetical protein
MTPENYNFESRIRPVGLPKRLSGCVMGHGFYMQQMLPNSKINILIFA